MHRILLAGLIVGLGGATTLGAGETWLASGAYQIEVILELPHVLETNTRKTEIVCLSSEEAAAFSLSVLSSNNPLRACPRSSVAAAPGTVSFDILCPGVNSARGHATYTIAHDTFSGRIDMKMGGKNMTMTEVQSGKRIGPCDSLQGQ